MTVRTWITWACVVALVRGAAAEPDPPEPEPEPLAEEVITITDVGPAEAMRQSAEAVQVIETERAQRQTSDLGEVLARSTGVGVRRSGGLGSAARFTLDGLGDDQIRFFLDGVPLAFAGYPFGIENVPINLIERIEVYRGVVPVRFGADALGGAINLVGERERPGAHAAVSYQTGSFGTQQLTAGGSYDGLPAGGYVRGAAFGDYADNDYRVDVEAPDAVGRLVPARVHRFHDAYRAYGANLEAGVKYTRWADAFSIRGFVTGSARELQHNLVMAVPYGEAETGGRGGGAAIAHRQHYAHGVSSDLVIGYSLTRGYLLDDTLCIYDWFGQCVRQRTSPGELGLESIDSIWWTHDLYARLGVEWQIRAAHRVRASLSPTGTRRSGEWRRVLDEPYRAADDEQLGALVAGAEYTYVGLAKRLEATGFLKHYLRTFRVDYVEPNEPTTKQFKTYPGIGAAARLRLTPALYGKASYEWAVRVPTAYEVLGDGALTLANHALAPERSHNANLGLTASVATRAGTFDGDLNGFLREIRDLILGIPTNRTIQHFNVSGARSLGVEAAAAWALPGGHVALLGNCTYMSLRNSSPDGLFGEFAGDRIPNQPYLFFNLGARLQTRKVAAANDELALTISSRYAHAFYRGWESIGDPQYKLTIPAQLVHSIGVTYLVTGARSRLSFAIEAQNVTDARVVDFYGQQRPGRAMYVKTTAQF